MRKNITRLSIAILISVFTAKLVMAFSIGVRIGSGPSVLHTYRGSGIHVTHNYTTLPDGIIDVGGLVVELGEGGKEAKIQVVRFDSFGNGTTEFISITELSKISSGRPELQYGVSNDNKLILIKATGDNIKVVQDSNGKYDIEDKATRIQDIDNGKYVLVSGARMADGRIKIGTVKVDAQEKIKHGTLKAAPLVKHTLLPPFDLSLKGDNEVRIKNPNDFKVTVGLRSGKKGKDFDVPSNGVSSVFIPNGRYDIYFVYSNKPDALFQGDNFTLSNNGIEIQIVKVVGGNYGIRQVK